MINASLDLGTSPSILSTTQPVEISQVKEDATAEPLIVPQVTPQRAAQNTIKLAPLPCGIVLFDHPDEVADATAYLPEVPAQRVRSPNDLRNDVLWVSNLSVFEDRVRCHPNLRSGYYFRILLAEIAHDMGIQSSHDAQMAPEDALKLSLYMTRTMTIAARAYGWDVAELGPLRVREPFLMGDIAKMLPSPPLADPMIRDDLVCALTQAYQDSSEPDWPTVTTEADSVYVTLRYNRVNYVKALLEAPVPKGQGWTLIQDVQSSDATLNYCLNYPTIVKATVEWDNTTSEMAALSAYGQSGKQRNSMRMWISQPELVWLSRIARVTINQIWVDQSGYTRFSPGAKLPALFAAHPESCLSYSAGLVAYNHWQALASCVRNKRMKLDESTVWATWLRAMDRAQMFAIALKAHNAGFHVARYGAGSIKLRVTRARLMDLAKFKEDNGFMYPDISSLTQKQNAF